MKTKLCSTALFMLGAAVALVAAPLKTATTVHAKPDANAPVMAKLSAGTDPLPASSVTGSMPPGWMAVELPGPFEGYVEQKDFTKALDVKPGVAIRLAPKPDGGVLSIAETGDKISITGTRGKWTQVSLEKKLVGYIHAGAVRSATPPSANSSASVTPRSSAPAPLSPPPVTPGVYGANAGQASTMVNLGDGGSSTLPRQFAGKFVSTRRPFTPRRPYDYALNDDAGKRYAYLDISKLLLTDQIENYVNHSVVVFGAAKNSADGKDIIIQVESLQLK